MDDKTKAFKSALFGGLALVAVSILAIVLIRAGMPEFTPVSDYALRSSLLNDTPLWRETINEAADVLAWENQNKWKIYVAYGAIAAGVVSAAVGFVGWRNRRVQNDAPQPVQQMTA